MRASWPALEPGALRLALARAALVWEVLWPALWPATAMVVAFAVAASFDILPMLPFWAHAAVLLGLAAGIGLTIYRLAARLAWPALPAARRRLEVDSGLLHRPLAALDDGLVAGTGDPLTAALWAAHRRRMAAAARRLRLGWPRAGLVGRDPYGLRALLALLLLVGLISAGNDLWPRVSRALVPVPGATEAVVAPGYDLWITPPDYTGLPPIYLGSNAGQQGVSPPSSGDQPIAVPVGSAVLARVHGGSGVPRLALDGKATPFARLDAGDFSAGGAVGKARRIEITQNGSTIVGYDLAIVPDQPPSAEWNGPVKLTPQGALRLDYRAKDDYGVKGLTLEVRREGSDDPPLSIALPVPPQGRKEVSGPTFQDLTAHPWAGLPVELKLVARDAIDQTGTSPPIRLVLPERVFHHPVARAIIAERKMLMRDPGKADEAAEALSTLSERPDRFGNDLGAFLGLRAAVQQLSLDTDPDAADRVQQLLWDTALKIEEGDVPGALKALREAEKSLQDALDSNAPDTEIEKQMAALQQAVDRYLRDLAQHMQQNPQSAQQGQGNQSVTPQDIEKMLDQARQMARAGSREAAKDALARLQDLLESLKAGTPSQANQGQGQQMLRNMQAMARQQQQLLDQAYRQAQQGREGSPGQQPGSEGMPGGKPQAGGQDESAGIAAAQEALRKQLGEVMRQIGEKGEIPQAFGRAERAMRGAVGALQQGQPGEAVQPQSQALDQLQQAARELADKMAQEKGEGTNASDASSPDPFGRSVDTNDVRIPATSDIQRSREILDELRRRAGDRARPPVERDYIDRLLQRF